jgi:hypothetical protein
VQSGQPDTAGSSGRHQSHVSNGVGENVKGVQHLLEAAGRFLMPSLQPMHGTERAHRRDLAVAVSQLAQAAQGGFQAGQGLVEAAGFVARIIVDGADAPGGQGTISVVAESSARRERLGEAF